MNYNLRIDTHTDQCKRVRYVPALVRYLIVVNPERDGREAMIERLNRRDEMPCQCSRCSTASPTTEQSNG